MSIFESIADRRIRKARAEGFFDDLPGAGKPIPDLDRPRRPGWWATRFVRRERSVLRAEALDEELAAAMPALWRLGSADTVRARVADLNAEIADYNRTTTWQRREPLDVDAVLARWRALRG